MQVSPCGVKLRVVLPPASDPIDYSPLSLYRSRRAPRLCPCRRLCVSVVPSAAARFQGRTAAPDPDSPADSDTSGDESRDPDTVRSSTKKERPISFAGLGDVKSRFEKAGSGADTGTGTDPAKGEAAKLRGMICGVSTDSGRQGRHGFAAVGENLSWVWGQGVDCS